MPFAGLGLHILLALFCAYHVVKTKQQLYWLFILFAFPLLGSAVYFLAVYLPNSRLQRSAVKVVGAAARAVDPGKEVRLARAAFEDMPTAHNQMRLAQALLAQGEAKEAASLYERALQGPFSQDPDLRLGAAQALLESGQAAKGLSHLQALQHSRPEFRHETVQLLQARMFGQLGQAAQARQGFEQALQQFGSFDAHAEYLIWALEQGDAATVERLKPLIEKITGRWNGANRDLNATMMHRLNTAMAAQAQRT